MSAINLNDFINCKYQNNNFYGKNCFDVKFTSKDEEVALNKDTVMYNGKKYKRELFPGEFTMENRVVYLNKSPLKGVIKDFNSKSSKERKEKKKVEKVKRLKETRARIEKEKKMKEKGEEKKVIIQID